MIHSRWEMVVLRVLLLLLVSTVVVVVIFTADRDRDIPRRQTFREDSAPEFRRQSHERTFPIRRRGLSGVVVVVVHRWKTKGGTGQLGEMVKRAERAGVEAEVA